MPSENSLDLIEMCSLRVPGGGEVNGKEITVKLLAHHKISRLVLELEQPKTLSQDGVLQFTVDYSQVENLKYDIKDGDACFPEIHIESIDGEIFRMKRGNFKDFFNLSKKSSPQTIQLPLSAFIYNIDWKSNLPQSGVFFEKNIKQIAFDFLRHQSGDVDIILSSPQVVMSDPPPASVFSLLNFIPHNRFPDMSPFNTSSSKLQIAITRSEFCIMTCPPNIGLEINSVSSHDDYFRTWDIKQGTTYIEIPMLRLGGTEFEFKIVFDSGVLGRSSIHCVRTSAPALDSASKMGISDGGNLERAHQQGGEYLRIVLSLNRIRFIDGKYEFDPNYDITKVMRSIQTNWIVSFKAMPPFLQQDVAHAYRHGPHSIDEYANMMNWLVPKLRAAGAVYFEGWNEANVIHEWAGTSEEMAEMQRALYDAVCRTDSVGRALTPSSTTWDFDYLEKVLSSDMPEHSHGMAFHGYTYQPQEANALFSRLDDLVASSRYPDFPIYLTEVGFRSPAFSLQDQALFFALFTLQSFFRDRFKCIIWFRFQNYLPENLVGYDQNASAGYGMIGYQGLYCRPALATYHFFDRILSGILPIDLTDDDNGSVFHAELDGKYVIFHYRDGEPDPENFIFGAPFYYDIFGNLVTVDEARLMKMYVRSEVRLEAVSN